MFTNPTTTVTATAAGLPDFDVVAIYFLVALFNWLVCLGVDAVAVATAVATISCRASRRLTKGIQFVAYETQLLALSPAPPMPKQLLSLPALVPTVSTITKLSPALPAMTTRGSHTCVLLTTSTGSATHRANASRARDMLHDLGVAFRELGAAETPRELVRRYTLVSKTHGVYPQLFVEPLDTSMAFDEIVYVSFAQLERMEFFGAFTVPETAPTTTTKMSIATSYDTLDELYAAWLVYIACGWGDYNFEDVWDFYTAMKLYTLMP